MSTLLEPFQYEFFVRALIVATVSGALCGLIGIYVVLRGMSYIGHGLSHGGMPVVVEHYPELAEEGATVVPLREGHHEHPA